MALAPRPHPTLDERRAEGREGRRRAPRSSHAGWEAAAGHPDPIAILEEQSAGRVPDLVPIRYGRMASSPFAFYRGAAAVMASDLAGTPRSGITVQACGDAHLSNFGAFASPDRRLVFDLNDFDETLPGPWEWDVKRLAASIVVAGRDLGLGAAVRRRATAAALQLYRETMATLAQMRTMDVWYARIEADDLVARAVPKGAKRAERLAEKALAKARTRDSMRALDRLTHLVDGGPRIISDPPLLVPVSEMLQGHDREEMTDFLHGVLRSYRRSLQSDRRDLLSRFRFVDLAHKVVGVGSVGTRCWIALLLGRDDRDPLFLQIKEANASVLERHLPRSAHDNAGHRVVAGQRILQAASDVMLGWHRTVGADGVTRDYYVRQLHDWKGSADVATMRTDGLVAYSKVCGATLARAHARSGDGVAIAAYLGAGDAFDRAVTAFAETYADQNALDHAALVEAIRDGRLAAVEGV